MRFSLRTTRGLAALAGLALWAGPGVWAQDPTQSLGDVARKARKEHASADRASAAHIENEDDDGPDSSGVWRTHLCSLTPCYELAISLPKSPKWTRPAADPRPVFVPIAGHEDDSSHAIRVYAASWIPQPYYIDRAQRVFLQGWFARPEYFGQAARLVPDEHIMIDDRAAMVTHFTVNGGALKYRGLSVVASANPGSFGFACVFREEDADVAASICDAIIKSARLQTLEPAKAHVYPRYHSTQYQRPQDVPFDNNNENDNPEE